VNDLASGHTFHPTILREYDIRGIIGKTLSVDDTRVLGMAFATAVLRDRGGGATICVGYDGRLTSPDLEAALVAGMSATGANVIRIGRGPTPMLYFSVYHHAADAGIMVTGSHNPPDHNGFKMMLGHLSFFGSDITDLGRIAQAGDFEAADRAGDVRSLPVTEEYLTALAAACDGAGGVGELRVAWDAGNGAAGEVMTALTQRLPGEHHLLFAEIDGTFPNHHPDPTVAENLRDIQEAVRDKDLDFGIALDGDGDRIGVVDGQGRLLWADQLLALLARDVLDDNPGATVIADVKSSQLLFDEVARMGGNPVMWKTGHSLIKGKMAEEGAPLAGEMSGHIFFADRYYGFDDALYAAVRLLGVLTRAGRSLAELADELPVFVNTPEIRIACDDVKKFEIVSEIRNRLRAEGIAVDDIDGVRVRTEDGWWLLRPSNTQAVLVARCEASDQAGLERLKGTLRRELEKSGVEVPEI